MKTLNYEWDWETYFQSGEYEGEVEDHDFAEALSDFGPHKGDALVLLREHIKSGRKVSAYVTKEGKLPEEFTDALGNSTGIRVPQKFHKELERYLGLYRVRSWKELEEHPAVDEILTEYNDPDFGPDYWVYFKKGYVSQDGPHCVHEWGKRVTIDTFNDQLMLCVYDDCEYCKG